MLGDAAALLGRPAEAHANYRAALEVCGKIGFRPEIALTRLHLAELLLDLNLAAKAPGAQRGEPDKEDDPAFLAMVKESEASLRRPAAELRKEAMGHLDFAIAEFRDMKMQPSLERALKRKEILKA